VFSRTAANERSAGVHSGPRSLLTWIYLDEHCIASAQTRHYELRVSQMTGGGCTLTQHSSEGGEPRHVGIATARWWQPLETERPTSVMMICGGMDISRRALHCICTDATLRATCFPDDRWRVYTDTTLVGRRRTSARGYSYCTMVATAGD